MRQWNGRFDVLFKHLNTYILHCVYQIPPCSFIFQASGVTEEPAVNALNILYIGTSETSYWVSFGPVTASSYCVKTILSPV